jgi:glycosyltransferase involved in cell wall biosynthesis
MNVLYFGTYERQYPRNRQVIACLRRAGVTVDEWHEPVWEGREHKWAAGAGAALRLARAQARLRMRMPPGSYDVVIVGYPGHLDVPVARRAARGAPLVLNPLVSLWETLVEDRRRFRRDSLAARALLEIDRRAMRAVDLVVADTAANADFLAGLAGLPPERVATCYVGAEERFFQPGWAPVDPPLFVGKLIPLHGVETVLAAAALLPERTLRIVGTGQLRALLEARPANVEWRPWIPYERLPDAYRGAACALGVFGVGGKPERVIPNKAFQALACGTPLVTSDTKAIRELLVDGESAVLVPAGDPTALASALERLVDDAPFTRRVAENGLRAYRREASEEVLGQRWRGLLEGLLEGRNSLS